MIEKLVKEFEKIRASLEKSKKLIVADIDKIDEKYRRLAQEEKKSLTENLSVLNEQLKYYDKMLGSNAEDAPVEDESVIQDTIFPENNEDDSDKVCELPVIEEETITEKPVENEEEKESTASVSVSDDSFPPVADVAVDWGTAESDKKEEKIDLDAEEDAVWDEKIESGELTEVKEKKELPVLEINDDGWAEFPEEWK